MAARAPGPARGPRRDEVLRRGGGRAGRQLPAVRGRGARARRRERRGQVHDREDARRRAPAGHRHAAVNGAETDFAGPADAKAAGIAVIYQEPTLFPDLSVAENIAMGNQPLTRLRQIDRKAMHRQRDPALHPARRAHRPGPAGPRPVHRRPAARRDRQGALQRGPHPDHGRADRGAQRRRGRAALRGRPVAARRGRRDHVHLAPLRGDHRALPAGHDHAGRQARLHRAGRRPDASTT